MSQRTRRAPLEALSSRGLTSTCSSFASAIRRFHQSGHRRSRDDGSLGASIVDPHGDYFADARNKLLALADYAEAHGDRFVRIESVSDTATGLRSLDLQSPTVRDVVRSFDGAEVASLYTDGCSAPYA